MDLFYAILIVVLVVLVPRLMIVLSSKVKFFALLGPAFLCYAVGLILSFVLADTSMAATLSNVCVPIAIPLILFSADFSSLKRLAKPVLLSFFLICTAVILSTFCAFLIFQNTIDDSANIAGMLVGLYTGGTPNLMAIGQALEVYDSTIALANTADLIVGGVYFFMLLSFMPRLMRRLLPAFCTKSASASSDPALEEKLGRQFIAKKEKFSFRMLLGRVPIFLLAALCVGVCLGASYLITGAIDNILVIMLGVTTLGILFSFIPRVRNAPGSYSAGQYFIYMFSVAIGLSFDFSMINSSTILLILMLVFAQFVAILLHTLLAKLFRIDADTTLITSTASIYGPAFIPSVANALKNKDVVLPGLICGILGYAIGNYLGIGMAGVFSLFS